MRHLQYRPKSLKDKYVIKLTIIAYCTALDFRTYRLRYRGSRMSSTDKTGIASRNKEIATEIEVHAFNPSEQITIIGFLHPFKRACNNLVLHEGAALFLMPFFLSGSAKTDLLHRIEGNDIDDDQNATATNNENISGLVLSYDEAVKYPS